MRPVSRVLVGAALTVLVGCQPSASPATPGPSSPEESAAPSAESAAPTESATGFTLTSSAFGEGDAIPVVYTCDGDEVSPPLTWTGAPPDTAAYVLIMEDPDASGFVHWVVVNLPPETSSLDEGASGSMPSGTIEGAAGSGELGYIGPCPPNGEHRYVFTLYALSLALAVGAQPSQLTAESVRGLTEEFVIAETELTGTYSR